MVLVLLFTGLVTLVILSVLYYYFIIKYPGEEFNRQAILETLSRETPVYYDDEKNLIGVFFENEHRIYIPYNDIPPDFVNALVAAEDKNFFHHPGVDFLSVLRAVWVNLKAGSIIQGGSTLTQQTAKNLFKRSGRTFEAKFKELIQGLKLEVHFSKEEIIEFFSNQFYVTGTGRGLAIAAKYFFDKPVDQLGLLEYAFIAGAVRAPNRYNPLVQTTPEKRTRAFTLAIQRKNYVLRNMAKLGMITTAQCSQLINAPIPFKEGKVYFELNVILDYIREELQSEKFQKILNDNGISNVATSGIKIYTFINQDLQLASHQLLQKHLSQLETMISGYNREIIQSRYAQLNISQVMVPKIGQFVFGKVERKVTAGKGFGVFVKVGEDLGKIDQDGLLRMVSASLKSKIGIWAEPSQSDFKNFLSQFEVGDLVYVFVRNKLSDNLFLFDLEQKPKIEGGLLVALQGKILAMVGGFENSFFNRAVDAKRQMGSIFKPLVYTAALQLGWNILDPLENKRDVFVFQNQFYFPRPDHVSPYEKVSLAWAGVKSENVASVWLLYHLCDKLSFSQFKQIADLVDLSRRDEEDYFSFQKRIRDTWGIRVTDDELREAAFQIAKGELITDLIFDGKTQESEALKTLKYGNGFDEYQPTITPEDENDGREIEIQQGILKEHFLRYLRLNMEMVKKWDGLKSGGPFQYSDLLQNFYYGLVNGQEVISYGENLAEKGFISLNHEKILGLIQGNFFRGDVLIEGKIRSSVLSTLEESLGRELAKLKANPPYQIDTLWEIRDYRILVGLLYVVKLCEKLGINTPLEPVLSFPLGPNAVSLLEILNAYTPFTEGKLYGGNKDFTQETPIIDRIIDADGKEIFRYQPEDKLVLDPHIRYMVAQILKNVVANGTGSQAQDSIKLQVNVGLEPSKNPLSLNVPTLGKTGTANDYSNSSYIGFIPVFSARGAELSLENSFVVATYVGYDDNAPMQNKHLRIFGASGALPIWIDVANEVVKNQLFQKNIDPVDFAFLPGNFISLSIPKGSIPIPVDRGSGLPLPINFFIEPAEGTATVYAYGDAGGGVFKPQRFFSPFQTSRLFIQSPWQ